MRLQELQQKNRLAQKRITRLTEKLAEISAKDGVSLDNEMNTDLDVIMKEEEKSVIDNHPKDSFLRLFWEQQKEALSKNPQTSLDIM